MQTKPTSWNSIFASPHITEYRFDVNGVSYYRADLKEAPVIKKPLLDKPAIGRCCTGSVQLKIFPKGDIPKAAAVNAYCRLKDRETGETTGWLQQGKFLITRRQGKKVLTLQCSDYMIKAGQTYRDKTAFTEWPQSMSAVVNEIRQIMGVTLDARTVIKSGAGYTVDYPNDDTLMSEVLRNIAAAHGGNWIMTEAGKLRLVPFASPVGTASQILGKAHGGFEIAGRARTVSRVILTDSADNQFTAGDDSDMTISASCEYATAAIAGALCAPSGVKLENGCLTVPGASFSNGLFNIPLGDISQGCVNVRTDSLLYGVTYQAYTLATAYLDPALELGDTISVTARDGTEYKIVIFSLDMSCTTSATCALTASIDDETEDEYPYISVRDLSLSRAVKTNQTYYGNRINRTEGFVSELLVNGTAQARLTANASVFSMQAANNGAWSDRIYFDAIKGKYVITGDVEVQGLATFQDSLGQTGTTVINGGNISTGIIQSHDGNIKFNLDTGVFSVGEESLEDVINALDNSIAIEAPEQMFTKAASATAYTPASITLAAVSKNTMVTYQWYLDGNLISGATGRTLTIHPADISGTSGTYQVIGIDENGNAQTDYMSIAKLADGANGKQGDPGEPGTAGEDSYTAILSNEYVEIPVNTERKPLEAKTYSCKVNVYKGLTAMTPTKSTPAAGQFKVTTGTAPTGITVAQGTAGTLTLTVAKTKAISDISELPVTITIYGGFTFTTKIVISANMNSVTITHQATITTNTNNIALCVRAGSIISTINQSAEAVTIDASKIDLNGYVTVSSLSAGTTTINGGCITTGTIDASDVSIINLDADNINAGTLSASYISGGTLNCNLITVTNLSASSITSGTMSANRISGGTIDASKITVSNLSASNITGGTLDFDKVTAKNLDVGSLIAEGISANYIIGGTLDCSQITVSGLSANDISTGTLSANYISGGTLDFDNITVSNLSASDISTGSLSASRISGGTLDCSKITVSNLDASSITAGTISASLIDVDNLKVKNLYYDNNNTMVSGTGNTVYLGGNGTWGVNYANVYAGTEVGIGGPNSWSSRVIFDVSRSTIQPKSTNGWSLGTSTYPFENFYCKKVSLGSSSYNSQISFFGHALQSQQTLSNSATLAQVITALKNYGLFK